MTQRAPGDSRATRAGAGALLGAGAALLLAFVAPPPLPAEEACLDCHADAGTVGEARFVVESGAWAATVHGAAGLACGDCHAGKGDYPHAAHDPRSSCVDCHEEVAAALRASVHGRPDAPGLVHPGCASCHDGVHVLRPRGDPESTVSPARLPATCGTCHADPKLGAAAGVKFVQPIAAYAASVHAFGVEAGENAATCSSCHGSHDILPAVDPESRVHHGRVPATCAQCHAEIAATFAASVHGRASARGVRESPVCTDCHGEHRILGPADAGSPVFATNVPKLTCGRCHGDLRISEKYGLETTAVAAFEDSFHGLAGQAGSVTVAHCASCHGVHDILPSSDPRSHVHPARLAATCGSCHPGAGARFAIGPVHVLPSDPESAHPAVYWIRAAYLWLIVLTIGGMALHNGLDFFQKARLPELRAVLAPVETPIRMTLGFRVAHGLLAASFLVLVYTGFALTFPEAWWSKPLAEIGGPSDLRGTIHRIAAVVMLGAAAVHAVHLAKSRRARACARALLEPSRHDWHELRARVAFLLGRRKEPPEAPWVGYPEKLEYAAVLWGTFVMSATGCVLWFEEVALRFAPKWLTDVATVVHFWEAVLASLAILVWHFYAVIFDPLVYPLDPAFWTGRSAPGRAWERRNALPPA